MTGLEIFLTVLSTLLLAACIGLFLMANANQNHYDKRVSEDREDRIRLASQVGVKETIITDAVEAVTAGRPRFEIRVVDWGLEYGEMRFRWTIFEADAVVRTALALPANLDPVMLGNAPTKEEAWGTAIDWVETHTVQFSGPAGPEVRAVTS